jgi:Fe-S oxidoreductase
MEAANLLRTGNLPWQREYTEALYGCTGCGACTKACAWENEPGRVLMLARGTAEERRAGHPELERLDERFRRRNERLVQIRRQQVPAARRSEEARVAYHPACDTLDSAPEDLDAAIRLLDRVADYVRVADCDEPCAGYPLWAAGRMEAFRYHARRFSASLRQHTKVVSGCPACVYLVRVVYPREGITIRPEFTHITQFLETFANQLPELTGQRRRTALYHDPCYLGRQLGVYDGPRRILGRVADVAEFSRSREQSECSGGGGLLPETMPPVALDIARRRLKEAEEIGVRRVVTACATCKKQFKQANTTLEIVDLVSALAEGA